MSDVVIVSAARTPIGSFNGALASLTGAQLGTIALKAALERAGVSPDEVNEVILGQVLTAAQGQNPARQAAIHAGIPNTATAWGLNQVCGSGLRAVALGAQQIADGSARIVAAGGQESMSKSAHAAHLRDGVKMGDWNFIDTMIKDGLWDAFNGYHMGTTAENVAKQWQITREQQDAFAVASQNKAEAAQAAGKFKDEITPVTISTRKGDVVVADDEYIKKGVTLESVAKLRPAFSKDGKITKEGEKPVLAYSDWMTSKDNPRFTLVIANRLWKKAMGMGLIEPVDEITDSTVPSNPQLMSFLEQTMKDLNYDMKAFLRTIYNSAAYQRAAYTKDVELGELYHFPGPVLRRMSAEQIWDSMVALYKPNPDAPSVEAQIERDSTIRRIEWLDRSLNALSPQELAKATAAVALKQKQLAADVRKAQEQLAEATKNKDEEGIRAAKRVVSNQRRAIDEAAEEIVYTTGFKKFAELAREGKLEEQVKDPEFAKEIATVIKAKEGKDLSIDEALAVFNKGLRARLTEQQKTRLKRDAETLKADTKEELASLKAWESFRDSYMMRAADLRSPAPNGHFLREFGQSDRELVENASDDATVGQALMLLNGKTFTNLMNPYSMVSRAIRRTETPDQTIDSIYLALFSRKATAEEKELLMPVVGKNNVTNKGDALWAVLNTRQFYFIQ